MSHSVRIDKRSCLSSGRCIEAEPAAFGWDADELGDVLPAATTLAPERLSAVARGCPGLAIRVRDERGVEIAP
jgi:ferredoxin